MVVDDESDLLQITSRILRANGYDVHAFDNPQLAIDHIKNDCIERNIVISDVRMPAMSCFELVMNLKHLRPFMKIILMTAFKTTKEELQIILPSVRIDAFLNKPFVSKDLMHVLASCTAERC
jgi:two-component system sensor histidine kinase/response regulator